MLILDEEHLLRQFGMTAARMQAYANRYFFEPIGLTISCAMILYLLKHRGSMTASELLKHTGGTKSNISQRLRILERQRYVRREENSSEDKRMVIIMLTERGRELCQTLQNTLSVKAKEFEAQLKFSDEEKAVCQRVISKINHFIDTHHEDICKKLWHLKES